MEKLIPNIHLKLQGTQNNQNNLANDKNKVEGQILPDIKPYKAIVIKTI